MALLASDNSGGTQAAPKTKPKLQAYEPQAEAPPADPRFSELFAAPTALTPKAEPAPAMDLERRKVTKLAPLALSPNITLPKTVEVPSGISTGTPMSVNGMPIQMPTLMKTVDNPDYLKQQRAAERAAEGGGEKKSFQMTWDDYNSLNPTQRAAVDFNTMLIDARDKDIDTDYEAPSDTQKQSYDMAVERMFGEGGGSDYFAPETLAVLNQLDFTAPESGPGSDLDDFLKLKVVLNEKDLANFDMDSLGKDAVPGQMAGVSGVEQQIVGATTQLQQKLAEGNELLQNFRATASMATGKAATFLGGTANDVKVPLGFGTTEVDGIMQRGYQKLAEKGFDDAEGMIAAMGTALSRYGLSGEEFIRFVDTKSKQAKDFGIPLLEAEGSLKTPEEFREMLRLDPPTREGGE